MDTQIPGVNFTPNTSWQDAPQMAPPSAPTANLNYGYVPPEEVLRSSDPNVQNMLNYYNSIKQRLGNVPANYSMNPNAFNYNPQISQDLMALEGLKQGFEKFRSGVQTNLQQNRFPAPINPAAAAQTWDRVRWGQLPASAGTSSMTGNQYTPKYAAPQPKEYQQFQQAGYKIPTPQEIQKNPTQTIYNMAQIPAYSPEQQNEQKNMMGIAANLYKIERPAKMRENVASTNAQSKKAIAESKRIDAQNKIQAKTQAKNDKENKQNSDAFSQQWNVIYTKPTNKGMTALGKKVYTPQQQAGELQKLSAKFYPKLADKRLKGKSFKEMITAFNRAKSMGNKNITEALYNQIRLYYPVDLVKYERGNF